KHHRAADIPDLRLLYRYAAIPHPRARRVRPLLARRGIGIGLRSGLRRPALLPLARGGAAQLVHGRADDAPGDPGPGAAPCRRDRAVPPAVRPLLLAVARAPGDGAARADVSLPRDRGVPDDRGGPPDGVQPVAAARAH